MSEKKNLLVEESTSLFGNKKNLVALLVVLAIFAFGIFSSLDMDKLAPTFNGKVDVAALLNDPANYDVSEADGAAYIIVSEDLAKTEGTNVCYSVVFNFRGYDTMGESFILIAALAGCICVLRPQIKKQKKIKVVQKKKGMGVIVRYGGNFLLPLACTFGGYVVLHGDTSPGGGFQGGVLIAAAVLLVFLAYGTKQVGHSFNLHFLHQFESFAEVIYVVIGILGIVFSGAFATNFIFENLGMETAVLMNDAVGSHVMYGISFLLVMMLGTYNVEEED